MDVLKYRGRVVTDVDVAFIQGLIAAHPSATRRALSLRLCEAWNWVQPNGVLRDMVCRGLLLALYRAGHIELPPARRSNPLGPQRRTPSRTTLRCNPIEGRLSLGSYRATGKRFINIQSTFWKPSLIRSDSRARVIAPRIGF